MTIGEHIMLLRKNRKLSQSALGESVGTSGDVIGRYERGIITPSIEVIMKIADALEVSIDFLVGKTSIELSKDLINRVVQIQSLPDKDREHILYTLDSLLASVKAREAFG